MIVWLLSAEYDIPSTDVCLDDIAVYSTKEKAFDGVLAHLNDGYHKEPYFKNYYLVGLEVDSDDQKDYEFYRFNQLGQRCNWSGELEVE